MRNMPTLARPQAYRRVGAGERCDQIAVPCDCLWKGARHESTEAASTSDCATIRGARSIDGTGRELALFSALKIRAASISGNVSIHQ